MIVFPRILNEKLSDEGSRALAEILGKLERQIQESTLTTAEGKFEKRLSEVKVELVRWMFVFWVGQLGSMTAILFTFFQA